MTVRNVLFIMCDQLRWDYLSCYGHRTLETPNIDWLASRGVRFDNAYVQGPVCGTSRMSFYTGRYMTTHGANWNFVPLPLHNPTLGDHLRPHGVRTALVGKTHMAPDLEGMRRCGIDPASPQGRLVAECGFEPYERDDGLWPPGFVDPANRYIQYLIERGYRSDNPWHDHANSAEGPGGEVLSGWSMRWARLPARVAEEDSETPYMTRRAMQFIEECGEQPWCLHLSYIKPHWPYVAPAPYHDMYGPADVQPVRHDPRERVGEHPVVRGFRSFAPSVSFSRPEVRATVIPTYMGLIRQIDDQLGRLFAFLRERGRLEDTMIVFTSDHGDYLGDHWLGEKELFHDTVAKIPLIVVDPSQQARRAVVEDRLVEAIDLVPTILDAMGVEPPGHVLEGRSLLPMLRSADASDTGHAGGRNDAGASEDAGDAVAAGALPWREYAVSEGDYAFRSFVREPLGRPVDGCRMTMIRSRRFKYVHYDGLPPQLFDLDSDPDEFVDLGTDPGYANVREEHFAMLWDWMRHRKIHPTIADRAIADWTAREFKVGIHIGKW